MAAKLFDRQKLADVRRERQMRREDLASKAGLSVSAITSWENGTREPTIGNLSKLSTALDLPAADFLNE